MNVIPASDSSLLVVFGDIISPEIHRRVMALFHALQRRGDARIRNLHPGYATLLIDFDPLRLRHEELSALVRQLADADAAAENATAREVVIPVCYDPSFGPDLPEVVQRAGVSPDEVVRLHSSPMYLVYFLGFAPGFAYLGGLPEPLHIERLATPRYRVAAGSVGIAGGQTGIYPADSPGGWRLIGRTPVRMFDPEAASPTRLQPGDRVKFQPIDRAAFDAMQGSPEAQRTA